MTQTGSQAGWITLAVVAVVVIRFLVRELRDRTIPLNRMWLVPAIIAALSLYLFFTTLTIQASLLPELLIGCAAGIAVGAGVGLAVDRFTSVRLVKAGSAIVVRGSMITVGIWIGALLLRLLGRFVVGQFSEHTLGMTMLLNTAFVFVIAAAVVTVRWRYRERARALRVTPAASFSGAP
jgi:hypothetical protein